MGHDHYEMLDLLKRWAGWFEAMGMEQSERGLCKSCLYLVKMQGHSSDCIYARTRGLLWEHRISRLGTSDRPQCLCTLEYQGEDTMKHPPTAHGHLEPRIMADPCPDCGGTDYYCANMVDKIISADIDAILEATAELYKEYYARGGDVTAIRLRVDAALGMLMDAWNRMLG